MEERKMTPTKVAELRKTQLQHFTAKLKNQEPFTLVKFNDGEWNAMLGKTGSNCDNHPYSDRLKADMLTAYKFLKDRDDVWISDYITDFNAHPEFVPLADKIGYPKQTFLHFALLHDLPYKGHANSLIPELKEFYQAVRNKESFKCLIAPARIGDDATEFLKTTATVVVPLINAYEKISQIEAEVLQVIKVVEHQKNPIFLLSCGFNSCLLSKLILSMLPSATIIDLGSALDPLCFGKTRKSQLPQSELRNFYKEFGVSWTPMAHYFNEIPGWFNFPDLYTDMVNRFKSGSRFVEVGAWMGKSASYMGVEIMNSGKDIKFDVVDSFKGSKEELNGAHAIAKTTNIKGICANNLRPFWSTSKNSDPFDRKDNFLRILPMRSKEAAGMYPEKSLDFVFIDAGHTYDEVRWDIDTWLPKIKKGGVIAGHDFGSKSFPGVEKAVREKFGSRVQKVSKNCWMVEV
jgi:hypothetical protein